MRSPLVRRASRTGSVLPIVALGIVGLCAFGAVAIDVGQAKMVRGELRNAAEAAAHAAVNMLDGSEEGILQAQQYAGLVAGLHSAGGRAVDLDSVGVLELGHVVDGQFVAGAADPALVTAARVVLRDDAVKSWFGRVAFNDREMVAESGATIQGGGPTTATCVLPIAVPSCALTEGGEVPVEGLDVRFGPDWNENAAWGRLGTSTPSGSYIRSAMSGCSGESEVGDIVSLNNGEVGSGLQEVADAISASDVAWRTSSWGAQPARLAKSGVNDYGGVVEGHIPVFDAGASCVGIRMNQSYPIYGYVRVAMYDAVTSGPSANRSIRMRVLRDASGGVGGGRYFGTKVSPAFM